MKYETETLSPAMTPEWFRLPSVGTDPYFSLTRSFYYSAESRGWIKLKRLRAPGKQRGVTLVSYAAVKAYLDSVE